MKKYIKLKPEARAIITRLQKLRALGYSDVQLEKVIIDLNLPLPLHVAIMGKFTEWMNSIQPMK